MRTVEVAQRDWARTLDEFSAMHESWLISVDVLGASIGAQREIRELPLIGITAETGSHDPTIMIMAGADDEHITHMIHSPTHVRIERTNEGADVALQIESSDGMAAIVRFKTVALPETVDGMPLH